MESKNAKNFLSFGLLIDLRQLKQLRVVQYTRTESGRQTSTTTRLTGSQVVVLEAEVT